MKNIHVPATVAQGVETNIDANSLCRPQPLLGLELSIPKQCLAIELDILEASLYFEEA